ncbi:MAG TPA: hypothetical protein VFL31_03710, partial [Nitrospiraceae bacterium]|nr:hypothetical protein [Nitrospiraceae bacterium]
MNTKSIAFLVNLSLCAACASPQQVPTVVTTPRQAKAEATQTIALPDPTDPAVTQTPIVVVATAPVFAPFFVHNTVENTIVRAGPGPLFT